MTNIFVLNGSLLCIRCIRWRLKGLNKIVWKCESLSSLLVSRLVMQLEVNVCVCVLESECIRSRCTDFYLSVHLSMTFRLSTNRLLINFLTVSFNYIHVNKKKSKMEQSFGI